MAEIKKRNDPWFIRVPLIVLTTAIIGVLIILPLYQVFAGALSNGVSFYIAKLTDSPDIRHAIFLTLMVAPTAVALNTIIGTIAAYVIARFQFPGRTLLVTLIDLPFSVSPVVAGLVLVLLYGKNSAIGGFLWEQHFQIIFAPPGLVLATMFVTFPFIVRELIPVLEANGPEEELAARSLGASGRQMFFAVTLPNIKWGLLYGVMLCNARAMGEFGAIYVVSGRITGRTDTMPLAVEKLYQQYDTAGAMALASLLTMLSLVTLGIKVWLERKLSHKRK